MVKGFVVAVGVNVAGSIVSLATGFGAVLVAVIGVGQFLWLLPMWIVYRKRGERETAKGILLAAGLTFLVNAGCWGLFISAFSKPH
jgi:hypothetical protein